MRTKLLPFIIFFIVISIGFDYIITDVPYLFSSYSLNTTESKIISVTLIGGFHIIFILWNFFYNAHVYALLKNHKPINKYLIFLYQISYVIFVALSYLVVPLNSFVGIIYAFLGTTITYFVIISTKRGVPNDKNQ